MGGGASGELGEGPPSLLPTTSRARHPDTPHPAQRPSPREEVEPGEGGVAENAPPLRLQLPVGTLPALTSQPGWGCMGAGACA